MAEKAVKLYALRKTSDYSLLRRYRAGYWSWDPGTLTFTSDPRLAETWKTWDAAESMRKVLTSKGIKSDIVELGVSVLRTATKPEKVESKPYKAPKRSDPC